MAKPDRGAFGQLLQHYRVAAGLSQEELAERAALSKRGVSDLERGARRAPYPATVRRLAAALDLNKIERIQFVEAAQSARTNSLDRTTAALSPHPSKQPGVPGPRRPGTNPLVGRERELAALEEHAALVDGRQPLLVVVSGPPGIGKSRLLHEFSAASFAGTATILRGRASQAEGMPPYLPLLQAVGQYIVDAPRRQVWGELGTHAETLSTLFPEVAQRFDRVKAPRPIGPEQQRYRLYEGLASLLGAIAAPRPLVLQLDDLQWVDPATCDALVYVLGRLRSARLLVLGACRDVEAEDNPALAAALAELDRQRLLAVVHVRTLDEPATARLASAMLQSSLEPELARLLNERSEGNPFFLEELVRGLIEVGALRPGSAGWTLAPDAAGFLPSGAARAIEQRLARLAPPVLETLRSTAVVGRLFDPRLVAAAFGTRSDVIEAHLAAAQRADVVAGADDGQYTFVHDLIRETLLAQLGHAQRVQLHQAVGEALETAIEQGAPGRLADLAFHFAAAGDADRGISYALAVAQHALETSAATDAVRQLDRALELVAEDTPPQRKAMVLMRLGDAATLAGEYRRALDAYQDAEMLSLRASDSVAAAQACEAVGRLHWRLEAVESARDAFERGLALLGEHASPTAAELLLQLGDLYATSLARPSDGAARVERALAMINCLGDRRLEARAYAALGNVKARANELDSGRELLDRALALARAEDDATLAAEICATLANLCAWVGDFDRSREHSVLQAELARRTRDPFHLRHVFAWIGCLDTQCARWSEAERMYAEHEQIVEGMAAPEPRAILRAYRGLQHYLLGKFESAERDYQEAIDLLRPTGSATLLWHLGRFALILVEVGKLDAARSALEELRALAHRLDAAARARGFAFAHLAVGFDRIGERRHTADCYAALVPFRGMISPVLVDRALGVAAAAADRPAAAVQHFVEAEALARRVGLQPELALALLQHGAFDSAALAEGERVAQAIDMHELARRMLQSSTGRRTSASERQSDDRA